MARDLTAIALAVGAACSACGRSDPATTGPAGAPLAGKAFYRIDAGPPPACAHGGRCEAKLILTALGTYHVNKDYPFKFVADPAPATPIDGEGSFALGDARHGTMTVTFQPAVQGPAKLVGTFKLSVCNDDTCEIETPKIELAVPVS